MKLEIERRSIRSEWLLIDAMKVLKEERGGGSPVARRFCHVLQLPPLELGAVGTAVRVSGAAGALSSPEIE